MDEYYCFRRTASAPNPCEMDIEYTHVEYLNTTRCSENFKVPCIGSAQAPERSSNEMNAYTCVEIDLVTWNIAAPNKNPFEFWAMHADKDYDDLMIRVQEYIDDPDRPREPVGDIFTQAMYDDLRDY